MSRKYQTGHLVHLTNVDLKGRDTKYAVIVDAKKKRFLYINTPKELDGHPVEDYAKIRNCVMILRRKYPFLNSDENCILCSGYDKYNRHEDGSIVNEITHIEDSMDSEDLERLLNHILLYSKFKKKDRRAICRSLRQRIKECRIEEAAARQKPAIHSGSGESPLQSGLEYLEECLMQLFRWPVNQQIHLQHLSQASAQ